MYDDTLSLLKVTGTKLVDKFNVISYISESNLRQVYIKCLLVAMSLRQEDNLKQLHPVLTSKHLPLTFNTRVNKTVTWRFAHNKAVTLQMRQFEVSHLINTNQITRGLDTELAK